MHVLKFGGTSMGDESSWRQVLQIISDYDEPVVIVSATARTTRQLVGAGERAVDEPEKAKKISEEIRKRHLALIKNFLGQHSSAENHKIEIECSRWIDRQIDNLNTFISRIHDEHKFTSPLKDAVTSIGEQLSAYLFARCGDAFGLPTRWVDAADVIKTDASFGHAVPDRRKISHTVNKISGLVDDHFIPVMGGFYGSSAHGQITTLGFEGSDYTASLVGADLQAEAIEIWTDVSGVYTCDPSVVPEARPIPALSYQEATELAYFGAKVLHPSTMKPASSKQIPILVKNIFDPGQTGTRIHHQSTVQQWVTAITYTKQIMVLTVDAPHGQEGYDFLRSVFGLLGDVQQPVKAVTTTEASVSVALKPDDKVEQICSGLEQTGRVHLQPHRGLISLIGCAFDEMKSIENRVFSAIADFPVNLISFSQSKRNLNIALDKTDLVPAVRRIHNSLFGRKARERLSAEKH